MFLLVHLVVRAWKKEPGQLSDILHAPLTVPIAIFAGAVLLSGIVNGGIIEALQSVQGLRGMLVYFWAYWAFSFNPRFKNIIHCCYFNYRLISRFLSRNRTIERLSSFLLSLSTRNSFLSGPMAFSGLAQLFFFLGLGVLLQDGYRDFPGWLNRPYLFGIILLGNFFGLLFCSERSAWFGAISAAFIISLLVSRRTTIFTSLFLFMTAVLSWLLLPVVRERLTALFNWRTDVSVSTRFVLWDRAWQVFKEAPIFGIGIRHFPHLRIEEALKQGHVALDHAHSNYLHILATNGLIGMSAYLYLWLVQLSSVI